MPYEKIGKNEPVCIADEVPFDIPESWEWVRFKNLVSYNMGKTPPRKESEYWENATYPWVSIADLVLDDTVCVTKEHVNEHSAKVIFKNHISKAGTLLMSFKLTVGKVSILGMDAFHNEAIISIYPFCDVNRVITNYLFATLPLLSQNGNTKTAIKGATLNSDSLDALLIPVPPIKEQIRICEKIKALKNILSIYTNLEQSLTRLNDTFPLQLKKSILQYAIQGKLVPQDPADEPASALLERIRAEKEQFIKEGKIKRDKHESVIFRRDNSYYEISGKEEVCIDDEIPFEIPDSWIWVRLGTALNQASTGPFGSMVHKEDYVESGIPIVNPANIIHGNISSEKIKKVSNATANRLSSYKLKAFDIIIGRRGEMGRSAVVESHQEGWLCGTGCFFVTPSKLLLPQYLVFLLNSPFIKAALTENSVGTTMNNLNHNILQSLLIPVPPINEQKKIMTNYQKSTAILDG